MVYETITLATIIAYFITAVFFFANAFIKDWFSGSAKNSQVTHHFILGLRQICERENDTCMNYDDVEGIYSPVFTDLEIIYYALLIGGSLTTVAFLIMLIQTEDKKRTNRYTLYNGLRYLTTGLVSFSFGGTCWMQYRLFNVKLAQGYNYSNGMTYDSKRTTGYILSWFTTIICFIAVCVGIAERITWKEHFSAPATYMSDDINDENLRLNRKEETKYM